MSRQSLHDERPWPWPEDSREDRAKRVARSYHDLVAKIAGGRCPDPAASFDAVNTHWRSFGVHWLTPNRRPLDPDEWMTAADLAHMLNRTRKDIYNWARLGHVEQRASADGSPEYSVASVLAYQQKLAQRRRAGRRT